MPEQATLSILQPEGEVITGVCESTDQVSLWYLLGNPFQSWNERSKFMLDKSRSKEGKSSRNLRGPVHTGKGPSEPISSLSLLGTWGDCVDSEAQSASRQVLIECCWEHGVAKMKENSKACLGPVFMKFRLQLEA